MHHSPPDKRKATVRNAWKEKRALESQQASFPVPDSRENRERKVGGKEILGAGVRNPWQRSPAERKGGGEGGGGGGSGGEKEKSRRGHGDNGQCPVVRAPLVEAWVTIVEDLTPLQCVVMRKHPITTLGVERKREGGREGRREYISACIHGNDYVDTRPRHIASYNLCAYLRLGRGGDALGGILRVVERCSPWFLSTRGVTEVPTDVFRRFNRSHVHRSPERRLYLGYWVEREGWTFFLVVFVRYDLKVAR